MTQRCTALETYGRSGVNAAARSFDGGPVGYMDAAHPVRVVVFNAAGESAASNERTIALL